MTTAKALSIELLETRCAELQEARNATLRENSRLKGELDAARDRQGFDAGLARQLAFYLDVVDTAEHGLSQAKTEDLAGFLRLLHRHYGAPLRLERTA